MKLHETSLSVAARASVLGMEDLTVLNSKPIWHGQLSCVGWPTDSRAVMLLPLMIQTHANDILVVFSDYIKWLYISLHFGGFLSCISISVTYYHKEVKKVPNKYVCILGKLYIHSGYRAVSNSTTAAEYMLCIYFLPHLISLESDPFSLNICSHNTVFPSYLLRSKIFKWILWGIAGYCEY